MALAHMLESNIPMYFYWKTTLIYVKSNDASNDIYRSQENFSTRR